MPLALQWDLLVNGTEIGQLLTSPKTSTLEEASGLSVTSAQRNRMNIIGTLFPFPRNSTVQEGEKGQPVTDIMQQQVKIEAQVCFTGCVHAPFLVMLVAPWGNTTSNYFGSLL